MADGDDDLPDSSELGTRRVTEPDAEGGEPAAALSAQEKVGRYVIQNFLAEGGMGVVYVAFDPELGRHVAIKLVKTRGSSEGLLRERLLREAQALAQLSHPNVISVHDVGIHDDRVFIAMELVEGVSLRHWLEQPRTWRETLRVLVAAGRGLAAAHSAGIVHRDFKPDNVIVGNDGRVCVLDFGLARADEGVATEPGVVTTVAGKGPADAIPTETLPVALSESSIGRDRLERSLTRMGTVIGTPAYMSPEHHRGEPVTSLSDQFSFSVAAWEALYRRRPFSTQDDLRGAKERQRIAAIPRGTQVPGRIRRLLLRGLSPEPGARHLSMQLLLDRLEGVARAPRRRTLLAGAVAVTALVALGVVGISALMSRSEGSLCTVAQGRSRLREIWSAELAMKIEQAFAATGRAHAAETAARVRGNLSRYADEWSAMHAESCAATHVRHEQSAALLDLRMRCLEERRDALRALGALLARVADGEAVDRAAQATLGLPLIADCADTAGLRAAVPLPVEPARREAIQAARKRLDDVRALAATGQYAAALPTAREIVSAVRQLGYAPLLAAALNEQTNLEDQLGQLEAALRSARAAALVAGEAREDELLLEALMDLMWVLTHQARYAEALALATPVEAILARTSPDATATQAGERRADGPESGRSGPSSDRPAVGDLGMRAALVGVLGWLYSEQGQLELAVTTLEQAVALREQEGGPDSWRLAVALNNLGEALRALGRNAEAGARYAEALAITEKALGAAHPNVGAILNNLATVLETEGKYDEARAMYERSLAIDEGTFGPAHSRVAISLSNLAALDDSLGRAKEAIPRYERALAIQRGAVGNSHPDVAMVLHNLGQSYMGLGEPAKALATTREALAIFEAALPADHVNLGPPLTGIGEALVRMGRPGEALPYYERALALQRKALGEEAADLAPTLFGLAEAYLRAGRPAAAVPLAEQVVALYEKHGGEARGHAEAEFLLARLLWSTGGERPRAIARAELARKILTEQKPANANAAAEVRKQVERWLATH
jgi:eukaryotic-like serine/threonine-protein kinase